MSRTRRVVLLVVVATLAITAVQLGRWQLRRLDARRASNAELLAARALPPLDLSATDSAPVAGRRLVARGTFVLDGELFLRGRVHREAPGLHVVTPFRITDSDRMLWVLRGFVGSPDATTPPDSIPAPVAGVVTITGLAMAIPTTDDAGQPVARGADTTWRRLDRAVAAQRLPGAPPVYLQLEGDAGGPGGLPSVVPPAIDEGPHLSYAIQWFGIALAIVAFGVIALRPRDDRGSAPPPAAP
ncbi:MAG TPA: SURF1 family protein [Gemmatimonadales bacterium]|nr:SURF1 family protein [Gemmatimonadales bacterium]